MVQLCKKYSENARKRLNCVSKASIVEESTVIGGNFII
jgi:hypothetical protein